MRDLKLKLLTELDRESVPDRYVVALSGGLDSIVLLHCMVSLRDASLLRADINAVHINHQLSTAAMDWQSFCTETCQQWCVPLATREVSVAIDGSLEAAARVARYNAFRGLVRSGDLLLLAHHLDDRIETSLFRLLRGAGAQGLSGIPKMRALGEATLWRPFLDFTRADLHSYAVEHRLEWMEDNSNREDCHDRNFLRLHVLPIFERRWPDYRSSWRKSLDLMAEGNEFQKALADQDLLPIMSPRGGLLLAQLEKLNPARQRNVIRRWSKLLGLQTLGWQITHQLVDEFLPSMGSGFDILDCLMCCHDGELFAVRKLSADAPQPCNFLASDRFVRLRPKNGTLSITQISGDGINKRFQKLEVRYRNGSESLKMRGRPNKSLKDLLREVGMPPWQRQRVPLIYAESELICVPGIGVAERYHAGPADLGNVIRWESPQQLITPEKPLEPKVE